MPNRVPERPHRPDDPPQVSVSGNISDSLSIVAQTNASLHLITGRLQAEEGRPGDKVLLPFAEFRIGGGSVEQVKEIAQDDDPPTMLSATLTLENMAFMVFDLASDLRRVCDEASSLAKGDLKVDGTRMKMVRYFVTHLEWEAAACRHRLDEAFAPQEDAADQ
ncbi:hypothetical protein [Sphingomonas panni]|uniref:hypothetical protein n=1 Tax=Sphingomonas panni TaxID=237612 RepID=UPI001F5B2826|nr:hypothetical protein [Sphingomonas panni]